MKLESTDRGNSHMLRLEACRMVVEPELHKIIASAEEFGWRPAEVAMALADAADEFICSLAQPHVVPH